MYKFSVTVRVPGGVIRYSAIGSNSCDIQLDALMKYGTHDSCFVTVMKR